jgi:hypothetical protein
MNKLAARGQHQCAGPSHCRFATASFSLRSISAFDSLSL